MHLRDNTLLQNGKYRIVRFISGGGFGCTYEAEYTMLEKRVAIKEFFPKNFCNRDETTSRVTVGTDSTKVLVEKLKGKFIDEARALSRLRHANIVRVSDVFEENGTAYYVMDYINGSSLHDISEARGAIPEHRALKYIRQVADALKYVHDKNRLHLDIKPGNIMIDDNDNAVLIDFGASKQYDEANGENTSTLMGKTPGYVPLEQMSNNVKKFYPATDIYSLGATLYRLLMGITPVSAVDRGSGERLMPLPDAISENVRNAVNASMRLARTERPQTIDEFLALLDGKCVGNEKEAEDETVIDNAPQDKAAASGKSAGDSSDDNEREVPYKKIFAAIVSIALLISIIVCVWTYNGRERYDNIEREEAVVDSDTIAVGTIIAEEDVQVSSVTGTINGHEWVDLGLSVKWATCNVGASSPSDYGNYYAWGETSTKSSYTSDNSVTYGKSFGNIAGNSLYDAARANWGSTWRLPTADEIDELINKCQRVWTTQGGHTGYKITGPNGNSIFLPAAGYRLGTSLLNAGEIGYYWSATPREDFTDDACYLYFLYFHSGYFYGDWRYRDYGQTVRPVSR